jgi:hypothetical protein
VSALRPLAALRLLAAICLFAATPVMAALTASLNHDVIGETDTVELTLRASGANVAGAPDFSRLEDSFKVLGTQTSSQFRSINGRAEAWTIWTVGLEPKRTGTLHIPSFEIDGQHSNPLELTVKPLDNNTRRAIDEIVFFETDHEPEAVYVQAQLIFSRRLFYADGAQLYGDMPEAPSINDAVVQPLGDPRPFTTMRNGRRYGVIEQRYAIFPEQSGALVVPGASVTGSVRLPRQLGFSARTGVRVAAPAVEIRVKPVPASYPRDVPWLPARNVEIQESFEPSDPPEFEVGRPVTRVLAVRASGVVASIVPPLVLGYPDAVKTYAEPPALKDGATSAGVVGTRTERQSLVVTGPGQLTLPAVSVPWWDTGADVLRTAVIAPRSFDATGIAAIARIPTPAQPADATTATPTSISAVNGNTPVIDLNPVLAAISVVAFIGWALTWYRGRHQPRPSEGLHKQSTPRPNEQRAYRTLKQRIDKGEARSVRAALDDWLIAHYGVPKATALQRFASNDVAGRAVDALNRELFADAGAATIDYGLVLEAVDAARAAGENAAPPVLPGLYPTTG